MVFPVGKVLNLKERSTGNGGGATWDAVLASSVDVNGEDIVLIAGGIAIVKRLGTVSTKDQTRQTTLFSYYNLPQFQGGEEGLRLAVTTDGVNFKTITSGALTDVLIQTPSVTYYRGKWYVIGDTSTNDGFSLYSSENLYDWVLISDDITPPNTPTFVRMFDADFVQGADDGLYVCYSVTTTDTLPDTSDFYTYISKAIDVDAGSFDDAQALNSSSLDPLKSFIDLNITFFNGQFIAAIKGERTGSREIFTLTASSLFGVWSSKNSVITSEYPIYEAPSLAVIGDTLYLYYDRITGTNTTAKSYLFRTSTDGISWSDEKVVLTDVTHIRHGYAYTLTDQLAVRSLSQNTALFTKKNTTAKLTTPDSAVFEIAGGITDKINGLRPTGYTDIIPDSSNVFDGSGKNSGQMLPAGYYRGKNNALWNGRGTTNLIGTDEYFIESARVAITPENDKLLVVVQTVTASIGIRWTHAATATENYTFSFICDKDVSDNLVIFDLTAGAAVAGLTKVSKGDGSYHIFVTWTAANTGNYRVSLNTNGLVIGDKFRLGNIQSEENEFPTPYVNKGQIRNDSVLLYESDYLNLADKYVMMRVSSNFATLNDYILLGSLRPYNTHVRLRPIGLDDEDADDMFVFVLFDANYDITFSYWETENSSGRMESQNFLDATLPSDTGFIQLGKTGQTSLRRSYDYLIVGKFIDSEFDLGNQQVDQFKVKDYSNKRVTFDDSEEIAPIPSSIVRRRSNGSIHTLLTQSNIITTSATYSPRSGQTLAAPSGNGSLNVTLSKENLNNGDTFYLLLSSVTPTDILNVLSGGDASFPNNASYVISNGQGNDNALVSFVLSGTGFIRKVL